MVETAIDAAVPAYSSVAARRFLVAVAKQIDRDPVVVREGARPGKSVVPAQIQGEEEGNERAGHRGCEGANNLVAVGAGKVEGVVDHGISVVAEAEQRLDPDSDVNDSRGPDWVEPRRSQVEAASGEILLGCETSVPGPAEAAVGIRREVAIRREFAMRDQHSASPLKLRFDRPEGEEIGRAES